MLNKIPLNYKIKATIHEQTHSNRPQSMNSMKLYSAMGRSKKSFIILISVINQMIWQRIGVKKQTNLIIILLCINNNPIHTSNIKLQLTIFFWKWSVGNSPDSFNLWNIWSIFLLLSSSLNFKLLLPWISWIGPHQKKINHNSLIFHSTQPAFIISDEAVKGWTKRITCKLGNEML